ncbi:hypothetical protein BDB00DRAFT_811538 [Zychaea mexicana]|uniref:uncharacterized protein n=1 Tax=Zychaea mexicana TaxID=64656 RepID=UPI0022FE1D31|nr:uncharacterized protein BDB00DRAFT_811538 [Zychaea mexicana]KAI9496063.1 hypothetical protein BDB00DRAFT_811538 [Zychaea mexicana]
MLPMYRNTLCKVRATPTSLRSITQARWNATSANDEGDNTPETSNANNNKETSANVTGIFNILSDASQRNKTLFSSGVDDVKSALSDSMQRQKQKDAQTSDSDNFDMGLLARSLAHVTQEFHQLHINATPNNTILTLTRPNGSPLITTSGGSAGFKKAARSGYEAAHQAAIQLLEKKQSKNLQVNNIHIILKGFGAGREAAFKALIAGEKWNVKRLTDATPVPFGGCRPKKARRL